MSTFIETATPSSNSEKTGLDFEFVTVHQDKINDVRSKLSAEVNAEFIDSDCERYLIAHNFDITKTAEMLTKRFEWYNSPMKDLEIDNQSLRPKDLIREVPDSKQEHFNQNFGCSFLGCDKKGNPIYWEKTGLSKFDYLFHIY